MVVNTSGDIVVKFTNEEKEILQKARKILDDTSNQLWKIDNDDAIDLAYTLGEPADMIKRILNEDY